MNTNKLGAGVEAVGFNRYMVECELYSFCDFPAVDGVLIDTWWNVNTLQSPDAKTDSSFNRYMVECELLSEFVNFYSNYSVLIDTWWNVNMCLLPGLYSSSMF